MRDAMLVMQGVTLGLLIATIVETREIRRTLQQTVEELRAAREEFAKPRRTGPPSSGLRAS